MQHHEWLRKTFIAGLSCAATLFWLEDMARATTAWEPEASEQLLRLPVPLMQRTIDDDFSNSPLALSLRNTEADLKRAHADLARLIAADVPTTSPAGLEHSQKILAAKRTYLQLQRRKADASREHVETRLGLYKNILRKLIRKRRSDSRQQRQLRQQQTSARARLERLQEHRAHGAYRYGSATETDSKDTYRQTADAVQRLQSALQAHRMNTDGGSDVEGLKEIHVRRLIARAEADLAVLEQEDRVIGYMAKLVTLDALAAAEADRPRLEDNEGRSQEISAPAAIDLFTGTVAAGGYDD